MQADTLRLRDELDGLERRFRDQGAPVGRHLRPGLSNNEIEQLTAGLPFTLSDELRTFYQWHDGVLELARPEWPYFPGGRIIHPLHVSLTSYARWIEIPPGYDVYNPLWFPINSLDGYSLVVDCGVRPGEASPIHYVDNKADFEWEDICAPSLLNAVQLWNRMLDDGYWVWDPYECEWEDHYADIPIELIHTHLV